MKLKQRRQIDTHFISDQGKSSDMLDMGDETAQASVLLHPRDRLRANSEA